MCVPSQPFVQWSLTNVTSLSPVGLSYLITGTSAMVCRPPSPPAQCIASDGRDLSKLISARGYAVEGKFADGQKATMDFSLCGQVKEKCGASSQGGESACLRTGILGIDHTPFGQLALQQIVTIPPEEDAKGYVFWYWSDDYGTGNALSVRITCSEAQESPDAIAWVVTQATPTMWAISGSSSVVC